MIGACPNDPPCGHWLHDVYEPGDPYPACCVGECPCGKPGEAVLLRYPDGRVTVERADPVLRVARETLDAAGPQRWDEAGMVLTLDTAGEHRYEYLRPDPANHHMLIFGRVSTCVT